MSILELREQQGYLSFDLENSARAGERLAETYQSAKPFPHIVMDDFLDPALLRDLAGEFPDAGDKTYFDRDQERLKFQFAPEEVAGRRLRNLLVELNSPAVLTFLEKMTGIPDLIPDPYFSGGGLHETKSGGHLSVHADFNIHSKMKLERRLNLLIYLNDDWPESYGGDLELWDQEMKSCHHKVAPIMGRAVVFNTSLDSFHGVPDPVRCPPDRSRRSIATYYYTAPTKGIDEIAKRTTVFKPRPGTADHADRRIAFDHFLRDWVPPRLYPMVSRINKFK